MIPGAINPCCWSSDLPSLAALVDFADDRATLGKNIPREAANLLGMPSQHSMTATLWCLVVTLAASGPQRCCGDTHLLDSQLHCCFTCLAIKLPRIRNDASNGQHVQVGSRTGKVNKSVANALSVEAVSAQHPASLPAVQDRQARWQHRPDISTRPSMRGENVMVLVRGSL